MEIISIEPSKVKVRGGLDRFRNDMGDLNDLVNSFKRSRQILPIVITRDYELIDGGRRLAACAIAGIQVKAVFEDVKDDYEMRMLELEANLFRKDFTPAEEALAIKELHRLKQERYGGDSVGGRTKNGEEKPWDIGQTAKLLGKSRGSVYNALEIAELVERFPALQGASKASEIKKAGKAFEKLNVTIAGLQKNKEAIENNKTLFSICHGDAIEHMLKQPNNSVDILLTDPLYGIEAEKLVQGIAGKNNTTLSTSGYIINDNTDKAMLSYRILAKESYRFTTDAAHGYIFCGPEYFWTLRQIFMEENWRVHVKPFIWIKREVGQCNVPTAWPSSCYEMLMYIRKDKSTLVLEGRPDWLECPPVIPSEKIHPYQKPTALLIQLLERVSLPGQTVYDPFAGSGSTLEAATKLKLFSIGVDESAEAYACMCERLLKLIEGEN